MKKKCIQVEILGQTQYHSVGFLLGYLKKWIMAGLMGEKER
jgi:hypothetical protein